MQLTVSDFFTQYPDDETCLNHLFEVRFGQGHECHKCQREANWYRIKAERAYSFQWCGHHLHLTVSTPFEESRTTLQFWFYAICLFTSIRHNVSAKELQKQLGVTYKTAWRIGHKIRKHMAGIDAEDPLSGHVEVDETFVGGRTKFVRGRSNPMNHNKTLLFGMVQRGGDLMVKVVPDRKARYPTLHKTFRKALLLVQMNTVLTVS